MEVAQKKEPLLMSIVHWISFAAAAVSVPPMTLEAEVGDQVSLHTDMSAGLMSGFGLDKPEAFRL